jgi:DNA-binding MarR family transcriptional regulator
MGLVTKYRNKEDDRVVTVELTEKGKLLKEDILEVPDEIYCKFKGDDEKLIAFKKQLDELMSLIEE